jgi:hypothetical protein
MNDEKHGDEPSQKHLKPCTYERSEHYGASNSATLAGRSEPGTMIRKQLTLRVLQAGSERKSGGRQGKLLSLLTDWVQRSEWSQFQKGSGGS